MRESRYRMPCVVKGIIISSREREGERGKERGREKDSERWDVNERERIRSWSESGLSLLVFHYITFQSWSSLE